MFRSCYRPSSALQQFLIFEAYLSLIKENIKCTSRSRYIYIFYQKTFKQYYTIIVFIFLSNNDTHSFQVLSTTLVCV